MIKLATILLAPGTAIITDPTWIFFVVLFIILFAPLLLRKLHIPHVIGLILAGVLIGQYGFNLLERDSSFQLFGQVGIYYIMFLAGLELDMGSMEHYGRRGLQFGIITFAVPFILGFFAGRYILGYGVLTSFMLACIFSSHTLRIAHIGTCGGVAQTRQHSIYMDSLCDKMYLIWCLCHSGLSTHRKMVFASL